jgi:hypothetical protein
VKQVEPFQVKRKSGIIYDPDQSDPEENQNRHVM